MATCTHHPEVETESKCVRCWRPFCGDCLVDMTGQRFCSNCRDFHIRDMQRQSSGVQEHAARDALIMSSVSLVICVFLAPFGILRGIRVLKQSPPPTGASRTMAIAAIVIGIIPLLLLVVQLVSLGLQWSHLW